jgi:membrane-bound serine protease (ClpP class)
MDTPGGIDDSMRAIIKDMLNTRIPVIVYVSPTGSRAASAGVFITYASDVAAMSPGTSIGAAHPVTIGGQEVSDEVIDKILNDSVSYIRGLAAAKGRNESLGRASSQDKVCRLLLMKHWPST